MEIKQKIRHLLAIANDLNASEAEREQAYNRAHSWMIRHGIKVSLEEDLGHKANYETFDITIRGVFSQARCMAIYEIILAYGSFDMVVSKVPHTSDMIASIAGPEDQLRELANMLDSLIAQLKDEYDVWSKNNYLLSCISRNESKKERSSFIVGWGSRVSERITEIKNKELEMAGLSTALVLHTKEKASEALEERFGPMEQGNYKTRISESYYHGRVAGDRAQLRGAIQ